MLATQKQIDYIDILCNDVGFDTRAKRNDFISNLLGYEFKFLDELAMIEASRVIEKLLDIKGNSIMIKEMNDHPEDMED